MNASLLARGFAGIVTHAPESLAAGVIMRWKERRQRVFAAEILNHLATREDYLLADIGLCRGDLLAVVDRPAPFCALQELALTRDAMAAARMGSETVSAAHGRDRREAYPSQYNPPEGRGGI